MKTVTVLYDGGGWSFVWAAGFTKFLQDHKDSLFRDTEFRYAGISAGSCVGLAAALGIPMDRLFEEAAKWARWCRVCPQLTVRAVRDICSRLVADDAAARALAGRFAVNVTRVEPLRLRAKPNVVDRFQGKRHLVDTMGHTCTIPMINCMAPVSAFYDGGLSTRFFQPPWPTDDVIRVSPWQHRKDATHTPSRRIPLYRAIVPHTPARLKELYDQGYDDAAAHFKGAHCTELALVKQAKQQNND